MTIAPGDLYTYLTMIVQEPDTPVRKHLICERLRAKLQKDQERALRWPEDSDIFESIGRDIVDLFRIEAVFDAE